MDPRRAVQSRATRLRLRVREPVWSPPPLPQARDLGRFGHWWAVLQRGQWIREGLFSLGQLAYGSECGNLFGHRHHSLKLVTSGGSGTGGLSFSVVNGSAKGCSVSGNSLTAQSAGTCLVTATKASDATYLAISSTAPVAMV